MKKNRKDTTNPKMYSVLYALFSRIIRIVHRVKIEGAENEPESGAVIACANHMSNFDVLILAASLRRQVRFFAKAELFKIPLLSGLIRALGAFPVERGKGDVAAIKHTISLLDSGELVGFFPQGTRHPGRDPRDTEPRHGIAMIAQRTGAKLLPVCIETKNFKIRLFKRTYVRIGKPFTAEEIGLTEGNPTEYRKAAEIIFGKITGMLEAEHK